MTIRELIERLSHEDPDSLVVLSKDEEGNGYLPMRAIGSNCVYIEGDGYSGEVRLHTLTDELRRQGYTDEDVFSSDDIDARRAVVLWP